MPRPPRIEFPGACYHVLARGNRRQAIFHDDADRHHYLGRLEHYRRRYDVTLYAYVLMTNHVHLALETGVAPLSRLMQALQFTYAQYYNRRYQTVGHLFQGRYRAILCDRDAYLLELVRYVHLNPSRTEAPADPWSYPWSSHRAYMGETIPVKVQTSPVLQQFGTRLGPARRAYLEFLAHGLATGDLPKFSDAGDDGFPGREAYIRSAAPKPAAQRVAVAPFPLLLSAVAQVHGIEPDRLVGRNPQRKGLHARAMLVFLAREWCGLDTRELGRRIGRDPSTVSRLYTGYVDRPDPSAEERVSAWLRANMQA